MRLFLVGKQGFEDVRNNEENAQVLRTEESLPRARGSIEGDDPWLMRTHRGSRGFLQGCLFQVYMPKRI